MRNKILVVLPTYNEVNNIDIIISKLLEFQFLDILVVDDNSKDGTKEKIRNWERNNKRIAVLERSDKFGLGSAYIVGFKYGISKRYNYFFEMDADLSHDPKEIPNFLQKIRNGYDVIIGSRYINGKISVVGWEFRRLIISKFGNIYSQILLNLRNFTDLTSGFRCYSKHALNKINLFNITSNGYAFQIEMTYKANRCGLNIAEIPIIFYERGSGSSKMSKNIIKEAAALPIKIYIHHLLH